MPLYGTSSFPPSLFSVLFTTSARSMSWVTTARVMGCSMDVAPRLVMKASRS